MRSEDGHTHGESSRAADFYYSTFALVKAMRLGRPRPVVLLDGLLDWYDDPNVGIRQRLLAAQSSDGSWNGQFSAGLNTPWSVIMLSPSLFTQSKSRIGNHAPVVRARSITVATDPGKASAGLTARQIDDGSSDPDGDILTLRLDPAGPYPVGQMSVRFTVTDSLGLSASTTVTVTVEDREAPSLTAPAAITIPTDPRSSSATGPVLGTPTASDNVGVVAVTSDAPSAFPLGATTVTWTAVDAAGNRRSAQQIITVVDREAPVLQAPVAVIITLPAGLETAGGVSLGTPSASDNIAVVSVTNDGLAAYPLGDTTVTWTAIDATGNRGSAGQLVRVQRGEVLPTVSLSSPGDGTTFFAGTTLSLTAFVANAPPGSVVRVEFLHDGTLIGSDAIAPYGVVWADLPAGSHQVTAKAIFTDPALPSNVVAPPRTISAVVGGAP